MSPAASSAQTPATKRTCVFCDGSGPLTREHVWPRWARSLLSADTELPVEHVIAVEGEILTRRSFLANGFDETTRKVCTTCNSGWMAALEHQTKLILEAMVTDEPVTLDEHAQRILAAWALKTAIVHDCAQGAPWRPSAMTAEASHLAKTGVPTGNVLVWLSGFLDSPPARARLWGTTANVLTMTGEKITADIYGATISLASVCFQVMYSAVPGMAEAFAIEERPAISLLWPYQAPFDWSERNSFADDGFDDLAAALPKILRDRFSNLAGSVEVPS